MISIAILTLREMLRRRFVLAASAVTILLVGLTGWGVYHLAHSRMHGAPVSHLQMLETSAILLILVAYMFSFVLAVLGVFIAAPSVANDIESGVLLPILTRPLSRTALMSGKALALALLVCLYAALTSAAEFSVMRVVTGYTPPHPATAVGYLCLLSLVMLALAFALSTRLSAIAASIIAVVLFATAWMVDIVASLGAFYGNETARNAGTISQLLLPTDAMWRAAVFRLEPAAAIATMAGTRHGWPGPFFVAAPPPLAMAIWTLGWIALFYVIAMRSFASRDL